MDGVLINFVKGASVIFKTTEAELYSRWPEGVWDMGEALGMTNNKFYRTIEKHGEEFWLTLEKYPWADELFDYCDKIAPAYILTTPTFDADCLSGKIKWMQKWKGRNFRRYILAAHKEVTARWDRLLIDDRDENCLKFRENGGSAIVFPGHNNSRYALKNQAMEIVKQEVDEWRVFVDRMRGMV